VVPPEVQLPDPPEGTPWACWPLSHEPPVEVAAMVSADRVFATDEQVIAPRNGFAGADDYYRQCSGLRFLPAIKTPTLLVHAADDPWIPAECYSGFDWGGNPALTLRVTASGGHVGFHGQGSTAAWHDLAADAFFRRGEK